MKKILTLFLVAMLVYLLPISLFGQLDYPNDQVLIKFSTTKTAEKVNLRQQFKSVVQKTLSKRQVEQWRIQFPVTIGKKTYQTLDEILPYLNVLPEISYAEPNYYIQIDQTFTDDPLFSNLWGQHNSGQTGGLADADIDAPEAWDYQSNSPSVTIGVLDTGIDWTHEDLIDNIWQNLGEDKDGDGSVLEWNGTTWIFDPGDIDGEDDDGNGYTDDFVGWDFVNNDNNPMDGHSHGTHCAGTIGAKGNNGIGVVGVTWEVELAGLKFLSDAGSGTIADAVEAVDYAVEEGFEMTSNSWGGGGYSQTLYDAIQAANNKGQLFVAAAGNNYGNDNDANPYYPCTYGHDNIISVAATDHLDALANFSNFGATTVDLAAPGVNIYSTIPGNGYGYKNGTSMATPQVAGLLALLMEAYPQESHLEIKNRLLGTTDPTSSMAGKCLTGGRLNALNALLPTSSLPTGPPVSAYTYPRSGLTASFKITYPEGGTNYDWDFGDGNTGTGLDPVHTYATEGIYESRLIATNSFGADTTSMYLSVTENTSCLYADSLELVALYMATGGANWDNPWVLTEPVASWYGVGVSGCAVTCLGRFTGCNYYDFGRGAIGTIIDLNLPNLVGLALTANELSGNIPDFSNLPNLTNLRLYGNQLSGDIPNFSNLPNLTFLYINNSQLSGSIPDFSNLPNLNTLYIRSSQLSGSIPDFSDLPNLNTLYITNSQLSGSIPDFSGLPNLNTLELNGNQLSGSIPNFSDIPNLNTLSLSYTQLSGNIPNFSDIPSLNTLSLNNTQLSGNIPEFSNLPNLTYFELTNNTQLNGSIPNFSYSTKLAHILFNDNQLSGAIPDFSNLENLKDLNLEYNQLSGNIPNFPNLPNLILLRLNQNQLSGSIPDLFSLDSLKYLELENNQLSGNIPYFYLPNLELILLGDNQLSGNIPDFYLPNLFVLYVHDNQLSGNIPNFSNLPNLNGLLLGNNQLSGNIPSFSNLPNLSYLDLENNQLSGNIPDLSFLETLFIQNNKFIFKDFNIDNNSQISYYRYNPQGTIPTILNNNSLSVDAGDRPNNTYKWYKDGTLLYTATADSTYAPSSPGNYRCTVKNTIVTRQVSGQNLTLISQPIYFGSPTCTVSASFTQPTQACSSNSLTFTNTSQNAISYQWQVDGATAVTTPDLTYSFPSAGSYSVSLIASDAVCADTVTQIINVQPNANGLALSATALFCDSTNQLESGLADMAYYFWDLNGSIAGSAPSVMAEQSGNYILTVIDYCNNTAVDSTQVQLSNECVWPGDFNYDGIVNFVDGVHYGFAAGKAGAARSNASFIWEAQACPDWSSSTLGTNDKHSDGNGDGLVDLNDPIAITLNYGKTHPFGTTSFNIAATSNYKLRPRINRAESTPNNRVIEFHIEKPGGSPVPVHGIGFEYYYRGGLGATIDFSNSVLGSEGINLAGVYHDFPSEKIDLAVTSTTGVNQNVAGAVATAVVTLQDLPNGMVISKIVNPILVLNTGEEIQVRPYLMNAFFEGNDSTIIVLEEQNTELEFYINALPYSCNEPNEMEAFVVQGTAPYSYLWSNGATTALTFLEHGGVARLTVTDATGQSLIGYMDIGGAEEINISIETTDATDGLDNGTAVATQIGNGHLNYLWSNGQTSPTASALPSGTHSLTVTSDVGCTKVYDIIILEEKILLTAKVLLQGNYNPATGKMNDLLRTYNFIPLVSPYGSTVEISSAVLNTTGDNAIVDWVQVELRDEQNPAIVIVVADALLQRDGDIVALDGLSPLSFVGLETGNYYMAVRHRCHLSAMTAAPIFLDKTLGNLIDLSQDQGFGTSAMYVFPDGKRGLFSGDTNGNGIIDASDRSNTWNERNQIGYLGSDCNMDGIIDASDRSTTWNNRNRSAQLP